VRTKKTYRHSRIQTQSLVQSIVKILHVLQIVISRFPVRSNNFDDLSTKFIVNLGIFSKFVETPRESCSSRVSTGEQNSDKLIANDFRVSSVRSKRVQESERFLGLGNLLNFVITKEQGFVNKWQDEFLEDLDAAIVFATGDELFQRTVKRWSITLS